MQIMIPLTTIKLILLTAVLWSAVSIVTVIALCSIGEMGSFNVVPRPTLATDRPAASPLGLFLQGHLLRDV